MFKTLAKQTAGKVKQHAKVDQLVPGAGAYSVYSSATETFDAMLNQTNIGHNNNKFYVIQLLTAGGRYFTWNRWGRVGEPGQHKLSPMPSLDAAEADFKKKFRDKTKNAWEARDNFVSHPGKYTMIDMADDDGDDSAAAADVGGAATNVKVRSCKLDSSTKHFCELIFSTDMFKSAMATFNIDAKKMPLGKITKAQVAKGYDTLQELKGAIDSGNRAKMSQISSTFYTVIPHSFGRQVPPVIDTREKLQEKIDMLHVLGDIEIAQRLLETKKDANATEVDHPTDVNYQSLQADLKPLDRAGNEFKVVNTYLNNTQWGNLKLLDVWSVNRHGEDKRFKAHDKLDNRRLLWHGTNVAVVAAILKSGLRIMPHSGGRVGRGIYLASENAKSAGYVGTTTDKGKRVGIMFLVEAALGKEHTITMDDWRLTAAPKGFDSIVARGYGEPDPKKDTTLTIDGKKVAVPQGKRIDQPQYKGSRFDKSEYLLYQESQHRIRYVLMLQF